MTGIVLSLKLYAWLYHKVERIVNFESWYLDLFSAQELGIRISLCYGGYRVNNPTAEYTT